MMLAAAAHVYITPHCTETDLAMPFIEAIAPATAPSAISWRRASLKARSRHQNSRCNRRFIRECNVVLCGRLRGFIQENRYERSNIKSKIREKDINFFLTRLLLATRE